MKKSFFAVMLVLFLIPQTGFSSAAFNELPPSQWTKAYSYGEKTVGKLGFGLTNILLGWTALGTEYFQEPETNAGVYFVRSIARTVTNTVGGALHVVTFPAPFDIPLPGGGTAFE